MESIRRLAEQPASGGGLLLAPSPERPQGGFEEGSVDPTLEDRHIHLDALREHVAPLHVHLLGKLRGRQVYGHIGHSSPRERRIRRNPYISLQGDVSIISSQFA